MTKTNGTEEYTSDSIKARGTEEYTSDSIRDTLTQRGNRYGEFKNLSKLSHSMKRDFSSHVVDFGTPEYFTASMYESTEMILHKLARIANGDPTYADNWRDIAGYAQLIVDELSLSKTKGVTNEF